MRIHALLFFLAVSALGQEIPVGNVRYGSPARPTQPVIAPTAGGGFLVVSQTRETVSTLRVGADGSTKDVPLPVLGTGSISAHRWRRSATAS